MKVFRNMLSEIKSMFAASPWAFLVLTASLLYAGIYLLFFTTARDNAVPLWILAVILAWRSMRNIAPAAAHRFFDRFAAWILVAMVPLCLQLPGFHDLHLNLLLSILLIASAVLSYSCGIRRLVTLLPVMILTLLIIPVQEQLFLVLSFPLRLISTILTVESFRLFGCNLSFQLTTIRVESCNIAITDACSGIAQLAVLVLLGYIIVIRKNHRNLFCALLHYCALVPVIIFANVLRLVLTILLFYAIGKEALGNIYHASLGFLFVIFATALFYWLGALFPDKPDDLSENAETP